MRKSKYSYRAIDEKYPNKTEAYSGSWDTLAEARKWYKKHGTWLEKQFNRKLILSIS
jgi:hypothetical protein